MCCSQSLFSEFSSLLLIQCLLICTQKLPNKYYRLIHGFWKLQKKDDSIHSKQILAISAYSSKSVGLAVVTNATGLYGHPSTEYY